MSYFSKNIVSMCRKIFRSSLFLSLVFLLILGSCHKVPLTGRRQLKLMPSSDIQTMSSLQYATVMSTSRVSSNKQWTAWVKNSGSRIQVAVETYMKEHGHSKQLEGYNWEFNLIEDAQVNAWCMPGGKVAFYTGIMPVCQTEDGVAVVMGHEIAHAIARHGNERMSQGMVQQLGGVALAVAIQEQPGQTQALFMGAYGIASQYGAMLPFSRLHESEADEMGLTFMAMAGYDPRSAPDFWKRMSAGKEGAPDEFLSTHPSDETRISNLEKWMPDALEHFQPKQ